MHVGDPSGRILSWLTGLLLMATPAVADNLFHGQLTMASGNVFRGMQQVQSGMAWSAYLEKTWDAGLYAGIWVGRTRLAYPDSRDRELNYVAGYSHSLKPGLQIDTALVRYQYDNASGYRNYDWTEWLSSLYLDDRWILSYGLGKDWFAEDELSHFGQVTALLPMPALVVLDLSLGAVHLENTYVDDYQYLELGLSRSFGPFFVRGMWSITDADFRDTLGDSTAGRQGSIALSWTF